MNGLSCNRWRRSERARAGEWLAQNWIVVSGLSAVAAGLGWLLAVAP